MTHEQVENLKRLLTMVESTESDFYLAAAKLSSIKLEIRAMLGETPSDRMAEAFRNYLTDDNG